MKIDKETMCSIMALNDEQKALIAEWNNLAARMEKAQMIFFMNDEYNSIGVANGEKIGEISVDESYYDENYHTYIEDDAIDWNAFNLPNLTNYYSDMYSPFALFDEGLEKRNLNKSMESAAL